MTKEDQETVYLRVNLKGVTLVKFKKIKEYYGVDADTECVRLLINEAYRKILGEP